MVIQADKADIFLNATGNNIKCSSNSITNSGDVIAFFGSVAVNANRATLNATGKVTAYQMIDHLLDKIEQLESRLTAGGL